MKIILASLINLLILTTVSAADDTIRCNPNGNQLELNACAFDDFTKADKALNQTYQEVIKKNADNPLFITKLKAAQKAWLTFRDADLDAKFACAEQDIKICWGSMYPLLFSTHKTQLTEERTKHLQQLLEAP